jgi:hypothetical protein
MPRDKEEDDITWKLHLAEFSMFDFCSHGGAVVVMCLVGKETEHL